MRFSRQHTRHLLPGVVFVAVLLAGVAHASSLKPRTTYTVDIPAQSRDANRRAPAGIEYIRPGVLAVWYAEKTADGELSRRAQLAKTDPWQLKMQLLNAADGSVIQELQWPTRKHSSALVVSGDGKPVLLTGPVIHCFDADFHQTGSFMVRGAGEPKELRLLRSSPGGKVVWMVESSYVTTATPINPDTCAAGPALQEARPDATLSGSDNMLVDSNTKQVGLWVPDTGWKLLYTSDCCLSNAGFVSPDLVSAVRLDLDLRRHLLLLDLKGKVLLDDPMDAGYEFGGIVTSPDAKTLAAIFTERDISATETGIEVNNTRMRIAFYNLAARKKIAHLNANISGDHFFGIALTPDSTQFALLDGTKLSVYDLSR